MSKVVVCFQQRGGGEAVYEGDFDVALSPDGVLVVNEIVPNVNAAIGDPPTKVKVRALYREWQWVMLDD